MDNLSLFKTMLRSRLFERKLEELFNQSFLYGTTHLSIGQEACHVGLVSALDDRDWIVPTHRCHGYNVARGTALESMFSEMLGSRDGICKGLGGSMHMTDKATYNLGSSAIVGSGISLAGGVAYALKRQNKDNIAVAIFGDGATSRGTLHEVMNISSVWRLPILFFLENNHYGMSADADRMISTKELFKRADGYSIKSEKVDGNDIHAVLEAVKRARKHILDSGRPYFIECDTYRVCGHSKSDKRVYRTREEELFWEKKDPIKRLGYLLLESYGEELLYDAFKAVSNEVEEAWLKSLETKDDTLSIEEAEGFVLAPSPIIEATRGETHLGTYREAIREALDEILASDKAFSLMGEDIGAYGGCFGVTGNLYAKYPEQILETPVSEESFIGMAAGAAMVGEHPIAEVMYGDFSTLASDGLINHASKAYFMSAGQLSCPMVYRTPIGGGTGHGSQHTQCLENMFLNVPGLIVLAPSEPYSAKALLKSAAMMTNPVLYFEHKALYEEAGEIGDAATLLPIGKGLVSGEGEELLVIGYSRAMSVAKKAIKETDALFFDLATLAPLDEEGIKEHSSRAKRILIVQDTPIQGSVGESVYRIAREANSKAEIKLVSAKSMPVPFSQRLESAVLISKDDILNALK